MAAVGVLWSGRQGVAAALLPLLLRRLRLPHCCVSLMTGSVLLVEAVQAPHKAVDLHHHRQQHRQHRQQHVHVHAVCRPHCAVGCDQRRGSAGRGEALVCARWVVRHSVVSQKKQVLCPMVTCYLRVCLLQRR